MEGSCWWSGLVTPPHKETAVRFAVANRLVTARGAGRAASAFERLCFGFIWWSTDGDPVAVRLRFERRRQRRQRRHLRRVRRADHRSLSDPSVGPVVALVLFALLRVPGGARLAAVLFRPCRRRLLSSRLCQVGRFIEPHLITWRCSCPSECARLEEWCFTNYFRFHPVACVIFISDFRSYFVKYDDSACLVWP